MTMSRLFLLSAINRSAGSTLGSDPGCRKPVAPAGATAVHGGSTTVGAATVGAATVGAATVGAATVGAAAVGRLELVGSAEVVGTAAACATGGELSATTGRGVPAVEDAEVPDSTPTTAAAAAAAVTAATNARRRLDMLSMSTTDLTNE
jgi:hypothetical protein